ncbi:hypothetical protein NM688_g3499 [Phlebia brevispora]|uniref:Uncharacterized protein n=1 Tax=Phlebia brevispora TaxID=194682 RepID=A0ACC1T5P5_9APHY|nr:hypothetical protein NM688_g3499 [Phlebia brevispora]
MSAVPSMAAAIAASLPAPQSAPTAAAPTYEAIPPSMAKVIDIEADIPLTGVQLDGLVSAPFPPDSSHFHLCPSSPPFVLYPVVTKIIKHARESHGSSAHGVLLGLDLDGTLEISNSFPLPHHVNDDDDKSSKGVARYQASMLRSLKEVQGDDSVVGFYQAMALGSFYNQTLVETQAIHQERLRHGGVVIVHGNVERSNVTGQRKQLTCSRI